jgi:nitronate monooxygenase
VALLCGDEYFFIVPTGSEAAKPEKTLITNVFTGRPARVFETRIVRELGPIATHALTFQAPRPPVPASIFMPVRHWSQICIRDRAQ